MVLFWKDLWHGEILAEGHARLFSFARNEDVSVQGLLTMNTLGQNFHLPLSLQARAELEELQSTLAAVELSPGVKDEWRCVWGPKGFVASKYYKYCFREMEADEAFSWIWRSKCTNKWKVFAWLVMADRINTRNMLKRRKMKLRDDIYTCLLCDTPRRKRWNICSFGAPSAKRAGTGWGSTGGDRETG